MRRLIVAAALAALPAHSQDVARPQPPRPGIEFESADLQRLQADAFANPGSLWVERGERLWREKLGDGPPCSQCHGNAADSMRGVAAKHPRFHVSLGRVANLEQRIDACNRRNQQGEGLRFDSEPMLALTAFVTAQSNGLPIAVDVAGPARRVLDDGRRLYATRVGQMNLSCANCHDANWGKTLLAERISQGHPAGWPAYRLEWQSLGSLQRRLRACFHGVRAGLPAYGSDDLVALELYLAARARGLAVQAPGVRR